MKSKKPAVDPRVLAQTRALSERFIDMGAFERIPPEPNSHTQYPGESNE